MRKAKLNTVARLRPCSNKLAPSLSHLFWRSGVPPVSGTTLSGSPPSGPEGPSLHPPAPASSPRGAPRTEGDMVHVLLRDLPGGAKGSGSKGGRKRGPQTLQRLRDSQHVNSPNMPLSATSWLWNFFYSIQQIVLRITLCQALFLALGVQSWSRQTDPWSPGAGIPLGECRKKLTNNKQC